MAVTRIIKSILPRNFMTWYYYNFKFGWRGNFSSWEEAQRRTTGYDSDAVIEKVKANALKVKMGEEVYERDGAVFDKIDIDYPLLSSLLYVSSIHNNHLKVFDYGGALGTSYQQNKGFLSHLKELQWCIKEQEKFVDAGRKEFATDQLHFFYTVKECMNSFSPHIALVSSTLQYLQKPYEELDELFSYNIPYILLDRVGFIPGDQDRLTIQKASPFFYDASYPCWFFGREKFFAHIEKRYRRLNTFRSGNSYYLGMKKMQYEGMLLERIP